MRRRKHWLALTENWLLRITGPRHHVGGLFCGTEICRIEQGLMVLLRRHTSCSAQRVMLTLGGHKHGG